MISKTFINRPKFAFVISIVISLAGLIAMRSLLIVIHRYSLFFLIVLTLDEFVPAQ